LIHGGRRRDSRHPLVERDDATGPHLLGDDAQGSRRVTHNRSTNIVRVVATRRALSWSATSPRSGSNTRCGCWSGYSRTSGRAPVDAAAGGDAESGAGGLDPRGGAAERVLGNMRAGLAGVQVTAGGSPRDRPGNSWLEGDQDGVPFPRARRFDERGAPEVVDAERRASGEGERRGSGARTLRLRPPARPVTECDGAARRDERLVLDVRFPDRAAERCDAFQRDVRPSRIVLRGFSMIAFSATPSAVI